MNINRHEVSTFQFAWWMRNSKVTNYKEAHFKSGWLHMVNW
jgi:hypothetical protein